MYQVVCKDEDIIKVVFEAKNYWDSKKYIFDLIKRNCQDLEYQAGYMAHFLRTGKVSLWGKVYSISIKGGYGRLVEKIN